MSHRALSQGLFAEHTAQVEAVKAVDPTKYWSVSAPGDGYKSHRVAGQVSGGAQAGYVGVKQSKDSVDVGGLVGLPGSRGVAKSAFSTVDRHYPEHPQTLDAFDERSRTGNHNLPDLYAKHGFQETGRMKFDAQYAPPEWDEAKHGRPDVVFMARPAAQGSLFPKEYPTTPPPATGNRPAKKARQVNGQRPLPGL
jgi:hypothetical protein